MRRLFWTFPDGLPGIGLLLLRLALSGGLIDGAVDGWPNPLSGWHALAAVGAAVSAAGLVLGCGTPLWAAGTAALEVRSAALDPSSCLSHVLMSSIGAALALLGPGAVSVDARLFGWRRLDVQGPRR